MTALRRSLLVVLGLVAAAVAAAWWVLGTEAGTGWVLERAIARTPGVSIARVRGSLLAGVVLEDVRVRAAQDEIDIARVALDWNPGALFARTLAFSRAAATSVAYRRVGTDTAVRAPAPTQLPLALRVDAATIDALTIDANGTTISFGPTEISAALNGRRLSLARITTATQGIALDGTAEIELAEALVLRAAVKWSGSVAGTPAAGDIALDGTWPALRVQHDLAMPFPAHAEGTVDFAGETRVDLAIDWRDLAWPGVAALVSANGRMTVSGTLADYRYDGSGALAIENRPASFVARGTGSGLELALERLEVEARGADASAGLLVARGRVNVSARAAALDVSATDANPAWWRPEWPGRLRGTAGVRVGLTPASVAFDALDVAGNLRGYSLTLKGAAAFTAPDRWRLAGVRLASGANRVSIDGALTSAGLDLAADADVANLDLLWPGLRGAAAGKLTVGGSFEQPSGRGRLTGRGISLADFSVERVAVEGNVGGAPAAPLSLRMELEGVARGSVRVREVTGAANGTTAAHRVTLDLDGEQWQAHAVGDGTLTARTWRGTLSQAVFDEDPLGRWQLVEPAAVVIGAHEATLQTTCLEHASGGRWCGELDVRGRPSDRLVLVAQNFELKTLRPLLPPALSLEGVYQLSASLFDPTGNARGALVLTGDHTHVRATTGEQKTYDTEIDELRAGATLRDGRLQLLAALRSGEQGRLDLTASIRDVRREDSAIEGKLNAAWPDIGFLALLAPELAQLGGSVTGELRVAGTAQEPDLGGSIAWRGGRVTVPQWGLVVERIEATAASHGDRALAFDGTGYVGDAQLALAGQLELDPQAGWPTRLTLRGESVRAVGLPEAEIFVTPDLAAAVAWPDVRVTGTVKVPRASLGWSALPAQAVAPSADAVVHGRGGPRGASGLRLHAGIDLVLGDDVHYSGLDLDTKVTGALHIDSEPNRSAIATGALTLAGTYDAYGQKLMLERGELLFSGPLDDPGVDVRAVRTIDTTRVGVELVGSVKSPRTRVFSTPSMSEADALSYLLLGRPMTGTGTQETATLETAAIAMGLNQALPVVRRLGATLGLDDLSVQTTATDAGALMAGKYLSPKLYIRYSYGLFNRIGGLLLRYKFNERLSLETRSGDQKSMDLLYTVEKD